MSETVPGLLRRRAVEEPDRPFLFYRDRVLTRADVDRGSDAAAARLAAAGLGPGDRAALLLSNTPSFLDYFFGAQKLGAVAVPANTLLKIPEIAYILDDSGSSVLVLDPAFREAAAALKKECPRLEAVLVPGEEEPAPPRPLAAEPSGDASIIYTSGTTGFPKGAVLTHANYLFDAERCARAIGMTGSDRFLCFLPLFHVNGQVVTLLSPLWSGGSMVLMERFQPKEFFELLSRYKCTAFSGVPAVYGALLGVPEAGAYDLSSLRFCICGAAPMPVEVFTAFERKFKAHILEGYGLSEGTCVSSVNPPPPGPRKIGSIGLPIAGQGMRIVGDAGQELPDGEVGEIAVRGANVMRGYWNKPAATAEALKGGWLHTGDLGRRDEDGYFFITGRKKEMIIRGGENIYPKEIEEALYAHPKVREAAVVGLPDPRWGEVVAAFLVIAEGESVSPMELRAFLKDKIADYKLPRRFEFRDSLPKTATGKIQKLRLRDEFLAP